ncbi:MAG: hypothetical protein A2741_00170 [Candidatus Zambryskibacteria bacterium RIFCSPHIGHO2_01_FULL_43_27]|nr:MAG: hypothetical protein A2741_00170 [Candidatus Zambryskibacteria bacterium RIFCSPHIGHO2_01_FULL_43_27]
MAAIITGNEGKIKFGLVLSPPQSGRGIRRGTRANFVADVSAPPTLTPICGFIPAASHGVFSAIAIKTWYLF